MLWLDLRLTLVVLAWVRFSENRDEMFELLIHLGEVRATGGEIDASEKAFVEARHIALEQANEHGVAVTSVDLAEVAILRSDWDVAVRTLEADLDRIRATGDRRLLIYALLKLAKANHQLGRTELASTALRETTTVAAECNDWLARAWALRNLGALAWNAGRPDAAYENWSEALTLYEQQGRFEAVADLQQSLCYAADELGRPAESRQLIAESVASYERAGRTDRAADARKFLAAVDYNWADHGSLWPEDEPRPAT